MTQGTAEEKAANELNCLFKEELEKYLPQYDGHNQKLRSNEAIKAYPIRQRWDLSSCFIKNFSQAQTRMDRQGYSCFNETLNTFLMLIQACDNHSKSNSVFKQLNEETKQVKSHQNQEDWDD